MQEFDVNIIAPLPEPPAPQPPRWVLLAEALDAPGAAGPEESQRSSRRTGSSSGSRRAWMRWAGEGAGRRGLPTAPPVKAQAAPRRSRGRGESAGAAGQVRRSRSQRRGGAPRGGVAGPRVGRSEPGPARRPGAGRRRGGGAEAVGPGIRSPGARPALGAEPRPPPARRRLGPKLLRSRAPQKSAQPGDDRRQRPSAAPRVRGLPSRGAGSAAHLPAAQRSAGSRARGREPCGRQERARTPRPAASRAGQRAPRGGCRGSRAPAGASAGPAERSAPRRG